MELKEKLTGWVDANSAPALALAHFIYTHPEIGLKEFQASAALENYLQREGFQVEHGVGGMETSFRAVYTYGEGGPSIGLLCEYDALEGIGHGCGHHMQGPAIVLAAKTIKDVYQDRPYKIVVYGTPAEETAGGKIIMERNGCFNDIDVALMFHGADRTIVDERSYAMREYEVEYFGRSSHAALYPERGRSATDAMILSFNGVEFLREHVQDTTRMHYNVSQKGGPVNVVPDYAQAHFNLRSFSQAYLEDLCRRWENVIRGACIMTDTTYKITLQDAFMPKVPVFRLNDLLMQNAAYVNAPRISEPIKQAGSTDFATVMYKVPGSVIRVCFTPEGAAPHSNEFLEAGKTPEADQAIILAAKILSITSVQLIEDEKLMQSVQEEFRANKQKMNDIHDDD